MDNIRDGHPKENEGPPFRRPAFCEFSFGSNCLSTRPRKWSVIDSVDVEEIAKFLRRPRQVLSRTEDGLRGSCGGRVCTGSCLN